MMQEYKNIDDLLRGSLEGYKKEPSPGVWYKISTGLFFRSSWFYLSMLLLIVATSAVILIPTTPAITNSSQIEGPETMVTQLKQVSPTQINSPTTAYSVSDKKQSANSVSTTKYIPQADIKSASKINSESSFGMQHSPVVSDQPNAESIQVTSQSPSITISNHFEIYPGLEHIHQEYTISTYQQEMLRFNFVPAHPKFISGRQAFPLRNEKNDYTVSKEHAILLQFNPEIIFSGDDNKDIQQAINFDLSYITEGRSGFLQAGLGFGLSQSEGLFDIQYAQYDSIGFYEQVHTFYIDQGTGQPAFITSTEGVFDTVSYSTAQTSRNTYYYLRIPVTAGLKFYEFRRFSFYAEVGATYAALVNKNEPGINYNNDQATSIEIIDNSPARINSNIQLSMGLGLKYQLNSNFDLRIDGLYNYYWDTIRTRQNGDKSPFSFGLKVGILYKL